MRIDTWNINSNGFLDKAGAVVSWLCAVHCLAMPFVFSFLPLLGISFLADEGFEYVFIGLSISLATISLLPAYFGKHGKVRTLLIFSGGIGFIFFADILFEDNLFGKLMLVLLGAAMITSSHILNRRLCLDCQSCGRDS